MALVILAKLKPAASFALSLTAVADKQTCVDADDVEEDGEAPTLPLLVEFFKGDAYDEALLALEGAAEEDTT